MALQPPTISQTFRVANEVREALEWFLEDPTSAAKEADIVARIAAFRNDVGAGRLPLPRAIHRNERRRK
ncbi:MAG: hypothetical protein M9907_15310 [Burkholderiaceae bacterium]|nr:hypothetical protein [Burkholderiaceae bacterium]